MVSTKFIFLYMFSSIQYLDFAAFYKPDRVIFSSERLLVEYLLVRNLVPPVLIVDWSYLMAPFSGALAGCLSKTVVYPLDVVKKRFQIVGFEEARRHFGRLPPRSNCLWGLVTANCLWRIYSMEGFKGLFKGWVPAVLKAGVTTALTFTFFEMYRSLLD